MTVFRASPSRASASSLPSPRSETVSVILTAWRRKNFLGEALRSLKSSSDAPFEIIVVADFRDEGLEREVRAQNGTWIVSKQSRLGAMVAEGVRAARGSLIAFLDDDDLFHPQRLQVLRRAFEADVDLAFFHNGHTTFRDGNPQTFAPTPSTRNRVPPGLRTRRECEAIWTHAGAGYNGSSMAVRRTLLEPHLDALSEIRKAVPPYLFYRAWCSPGALLVDSQALTAVRIHSSNMTSTPLQGRTAHLSRLAAIGADLSADADRILQFVPPDVWSIPLRQMSSMGDIVSVLNGSRPSPRRRLLGATLELLRRRRIWLPRWALVGIALLSIGSRRGTRALFNWMTTRGLRA